jgi:hypothetical protein
MNKYESQSHSRRRSFIQYLHADAVTWRSYLLRSTVPSIELTCHQASTITIQSHEALVSLSESIKMAQDYLSTVTL